MELSDSIQSKFNIDVLSNDPLVFTIDNFLTNEECDHLIALAKPNFQQALVSDGKKGVVSKGRTGSNCWIKKDTDKITRGVAKKISNLVQIPLENTENFQAIYYGVDQRYNAHFDAYVKEDTEKCRRCLKYGGQRVLTALLYLNDVESGGGTSFPKLEISSNAQKGKLLVFNNCLEGTTDLHPHSLHAGLPVDEGEKYAINLWFREISKSKLYDFPFLSK
jgi:prolyl 4-hydroxylase